MVFYIKTSLKAPNNEKKKKKKTCPKTYIEHRWGGKNGKNAQRRFAPKQCNSIFAAGPSNKLTHDKSIHTYNII